MEAGVTQQFPRPCLDLLQGLSAQSDQTDWIPVQWPFLGEVSGRLSLVYTEKNPVLKLPQVAPSGSALVGFRCCFLFAGSL